MKVPYTDVHKLTEDDRIALIGKAVMEGDMVVGVMVDDDSYEVGKVDRYIRKLQQGYPGIRLISRTPGPVAGVTLVKFGPPEKLNQVM